MAPPIFSWKFALACALLFVIIAIAERKRHHAFRGGPLDVTQRVTMRVVPRLRAVLDLLDVEFGHVESTARTHDAMEWPVFSSTVPIDYDTLDLSDEALSFLVAHDMAHLRPRHGAIRYLASLVALYAMYLVLVVATLHPWAGSWTPLATAIVATPAAIGLPFGAWYLSRRWFAQRCEDGADDYALRFVYLAAAEEALTARAVGARTSACSARRIERLRARYDGVRGAAPASA